MNELQDISQLKPKTRVVQILHPRTGDELGISVEVMSFGDPRLKRIIRQINDQKQEREARRKILKTEELESNSVRLVANAIVGWDWSKSKFGFKGELPAFSPAKAVEVLSELDWFFTQLNEEIGNDKAFF